MGNSRRSAEGAPWVAAADTGPAEVSSHAAAAVIECIRMAVARMTKEWMMR